MVEVYDTLVLPALALAETDWHRGEIDEVRHEFILRSLKEIISERDERPRDGSAIEVAEEGVSSRACVLCLPARDEADAIAGLMLTQLLTSNGCLVRSVAVSAAVGDLVDLVERHKAAVVCVSSTPPTAVTYARRLCRQLRARLADVHIVVGLWSTQSDLSKARVRIGGGDTTHVVATLAEGKHRSAC